MHYQSVCRYRTTLPTLICMFLSTRKNIHLKGTGPTCALWCTMQVGGAQCRSVVHNIVLHSRGNAQRRSHKPKQTGRQAERQTDKIICETSLKKALLLFPHPLINSAPSTTSPFTSLFVILGQIGQPRTNRNKQFDKRFIFKIPFYKVLVQLSELRHNLWDH